MRARAFFNSSKLMLPGAVIGATYGPGFYGRYSWRLAIDDEGNLFQEAKVFVDLGIDEQRRHHVPIGQEAVLQLLLLAEEFNFYALNKNYQASITGQEGYCLSVRFGEHDHTVTTYGADWLALGGDLEMQNFLRLWDAVHRYAPFPEKANAT